MNKPGKGDGKIDGLIGIFKTKGLKLTPARKTMLDVFLTNDSKLVDAMEIYDQVKCRMPEINFSTVYRNLEIFMQNEIIEKVNLGRKAAFTLLLPRRHRHHMICTSCLKTIPLPYCPLKELENSLKTGCDGFLPVEHKVEIYGYCADCQKRD